MNILKGAIIFIAGVGVGAAAAYAYLKDTYERIAEDEIEEMREYYTNKKRVRKELDKYVDIIKEEEGYVSYSTAEVQKDIMEGFERKAQQEYPREDWPEQPVIIDESDFSEDRLDFEKISLDYFMDDGALVDETDSLVEMEDTVGFENMEGFLNDEDQLVMYIRNQKLGCDYEVTKVGGSYSQIQGIGGDDD